MTHGTPAKPIAVLGKPAIAPCGAKLRPATALESGDSFSASTRYITCADCIRRGLAGEWELLGPDLEPLR